MTRLVAWLFLCCALPAQTVPPGVPQSMRTLSPLAPSGSVLKCEVGYGGVLHGFRVYDGTPGWALISTPASVRPPSQSEDGIGQVCVAAAGTGGLPNSIVQQGQATALQFGSTWLPQNSRVRQMDTLGALGGPAWCGWWECWDSVLGDTAASPIWMQTTLGVRTGEAGRVWIRSDVTAHRMGGLPAYRYERWNLPYLVIDGTKVVAVDVDSVRIPISAIPDGSVATPRLTLAPIANPLVRITASAAAGGRAVLIRAAQWDSVLMWRPHPEVLIITGIVNNRPCLAGQPVSLWWEIEGQ